MPLGNLYFCIIGNCNLQLHSYHTKTKFNCPCVTPWKMCRWHIFRRDWDARASEIIRKTLFFNNIIFSAFAWCAHGRKKLYPFLPAAGERQRRFFTKALRVMSHPFTWSCSENIRLFPCKTWCTFGFDVHF